MVSKGWLLVMVCLVVRSMAAQTPVSPGRTTGDAMNSAKTGAYYERYADELRAKERMEKGRTALKTRKFREVLSQNDVRVLNATAGRFITGGGTSFVALQVGVPSELKAGATVTLFGQVFDATGHVLTDFEVPATVQESKGDLFVEHSLLSAEGLSTRVGLAKGDTVLGVADLMLSSGELSELIVSNNVFNLPQAQKPFEPFAFGGTKVIPKPDRIFRPADEAWLFVELREADPAAPAPTLSIRAAVEGEGRKIAGAWQRAEVLPLKGVAGHYGVGTTVDLSSLEPGSYRVTLSVRDDGDKEITERVQTITVRQ